jgi:phosphate starvation-inducible protein PhoH and related proteins
LLEKVITLENVSLVDFLGVENENIREIAAAFPDSKIVSRGNEIRIQGAPPQILRINDVLNGLLDHYAKYGKVSNEHVKDYLHQAFPDADLKEEDKVIIYGTRGTRVVPKTPNQKNLVKAVAENDLVFALGPAGTGKTYLSVALAVRALKNKDVKKIIITRPAVEAGENLGFLPGDMREKIDPFLRPIYDALHDMIQGEKLKHYMENGVVEIAPLAYMRGRTLNNAFILLDEAQNTTPMQIKMFLTRLGPESKVIVNGDRSQIDLPHKQISGLNHAIDVLKDVKGISMVEFDERDVVRHKLVKEIIKAYGRYVENGKG